MDRFWLKSYPAGVPSDIDPSVYPSVVALLEESFAKYRDSKAYVCMGKGITFGDIDRLSQALAAWLQGSGGVRARQQMVQQLIRDVGSFPSSHTGVPSFPLYLESG